MDSQLWSAVSTAARSRAWYYRLLRIVLFSAVGWVGWQALRPLQAEEAHDRAWPKTDFTRTTVDLGEIISGGPPKDGIPAIDRPRFDTIHEADTWLDPREPVIVLTWNERARAYPLQILIYHEIVNDVFQGRPVAVTFCPLCNASLVFDRRLRGRVLDFGTTGKLRKSDFVMYDRQTESWWQQFTGKEIVGLTPGQVFRHCHHRSFLTRNSAVPIQRVKSCLAIQIMSGLMAAIPTVGMIESATGRFCSLIR